MKTYKHLIQMINESEPTDGGGFGLPTSNSYGRSAFNDTGLHNIRKPEQLKKLNAFISAFTQKEFLDPKQALNVLRTKLNMAGYDFPIDKTVDIMSDELTEFRLLKNGGTFGKTVDTPIDEFEETDGFPDGEGYVLEVKVVDVPNGLYRIEASIKESTEEADVEVDDAKNSQKIHSGMSNEETEIKRFLDYTDNESEDN